MTSIVLTVFYTMMIAILTFTVIGVIVAVINDYYNRKDLQRRIEAGRRKEQKKRDETH